MKQEVRVKIDVSIELDAKYKSGPELTKIIERNARAVFKNNNRTFHSIKYKEEAALYSIPSRKWVEALPAEKGSSC